MNDHASSNPVIALRPTYLLFDKAYKIEWKELKLRDFELLHKYREKQNFILFSAGAQSTQHCSAK